MSNPQDLLETGRHLHMQGRWPEAEQHYRAALSLQPGHPLVLQHLAMLSLDTGRLEEAEHLFTGIVQAAPTMTAAQLGLGNARLALGRHDGALMAFQAAQKSEPANAAAFFGAGHALQSLGRIAEARASFEQAVKLAPDIPAFHYPLAAIARFTKSDPRLAALEALAKKEPANSDGRSADLHFALGKAYDDLGRHAEAFEHYDEGNAIRRGQIAYNEAHELEAFQALATAFPKELFERLAGAGDPASEPVFIVGMPRCGSSLVEQILASHPKVFGAGELMYLPQLIDAGQAGANFPFGVGALDAAALRRFGSFYAAALRRLAPEAERVIDKALSNFRFVGLIRLALPNARIIHVRRNRLDTCLSCYFHLFAQGVSFAYDLGELGRCYKAYEGLMAHWRAVLPPDAMLEVDYEALVASPEEQTRRILDYCGLDWDARCLDFHQTERVVHTVSAAQVRQPINRASIDRWKPYEEYLSALKSALGTGETD